jgi:hypothetical protein
MIELTEEQRRALKDGEAVRLSEAEIGTDCVLVRADVYEQVRSLVNAGRLGLDEQRALLHAAALRAGWDDPAMDVYDQEDDEAASQP